MTTPKQAQKSSGDGPRLYSWPPTPPHEFQVISVTSATKMLPKEFLVGWAAKMSANCAWDDFEALKLFHEKGQERAFIDHVKGARFRDMNEKADRGTIVHAALEAYLAGKPLDESDVKVLLTDARVPTKMWKSTTGMISALMAFLADVEPEVLWSESTVYSRSRGYAGTTDLIANVFIGGTRRPVVIDIKTSKRIYDDVACQLAGYARADFVGLDDGTEKPLLESGEVIEYGMVVRPMAGGRYETATFALTDEVYDRFLAALAIARTNGAEERAKRP